MINIIIFRCVRFGYLACLVCSLFTCGVSGLIPSSSPSYFPSPRQLSQVREKRQHSMEFCTLAENTRSKQKRHSNTQKKTQKQKRNRPAKHRDCDYPDRLYAKTFLSLGSVYTVVAVALERYFNICKPFSRNLVSLDNIPLLTSFVDI